MVLNFVESSTAGSPTDPKVKWTSSRPKDISKYLWEKHKQKISYSCIKRILKKAGYVKRKPIKTVDIGTSKYRAEQFKIVIYLTGLFHKMGNNPMLSIDTKKKEKLGNFTRDEQVLVKKDQPLQVYSSDYYHLADGKAIPHGIFDIKLNKGYISLGNSHETAAFVIDNLRWWWANFGKKYYQDATHLLIFCDCGGANGYRHFLFKVLQRLSREIGVKIVVAHYPPYCSKYNPIERKLFSHVHHTIKSTILTDLQQVKKLMAKTSNSKGLTVEVRIVDKFYPLKQPSNKEDIDEKRIFRHPLLPKFSYTLLP